MPIINIQKKKIPLNAYLKADPHSQIYMIESEKGEREQLVSSEMFWGNSNDEAIYLDYFNVNGRNITVSKGISENCRSQVYRNEHCDNWIEDHLVKNNMNQLYVIRGYAGCGKTTFINYLVQKRNKHMNITHIDVGEKWSYQNEPYMFFTQVLNILDRHIENIINNRNARDKILEEFFKLGSYSQIDCFHTELPNIISNLGIIKKNSQWETLKNNIREYLYDSYSERKRNDNCESKSENRSIIWHSVGQIGVIIAVLILLICAQCNVEQSENNEHTLIFDNLDVITNPAIPSEIIVSLWSVIDGFNKYKNSYESRYDKQLIDFNMIIAVRKVLYSHIVSHLPDLEMTLNYDSYYVNVCDISNLYLSQDILEHRINYWKKYIEDSKTKDKLSQLGQITAVVSNNEEEINVDGYHSVHHSINLDALFNHNYRAFSNMLATFFENKNYSMNIIRDFEKGSSSFSWQKVATLIFVISLFYRKEKIWNELGFGCKDFNIIDYPTTFNRLILNYLYVAKQGQELRRIAPERNDIPYESEVSLETLVKIFNKVKFIPATVNSNEEQLKANYQKDENMDSTELLLERLADMSARNPRITNSKAYGYDSENDELWRRPLFFTGGVKLNHTAASDIDLKEYFTQCVKEGSLGKIKFSITDEGFILIKDIVANFEFYSARYCDESSGKPLHQATSVDEINMIISPVYNAIKLCCNRHDVFMTQYMHNYGIEKNTYLKRYFHPRTNPRYSTNQIKELNKTSFRPQLHIVRVIYSHIAYFSEIRELFETKDEENNSQLCNCLSSWIDAYLSLYKSQFLSKLKNTICYSDNNVYNDIKSKMPKKIIQ